MIGLRKEGIQKNQDIYNFELSIEAFGPLKEPEEERNQWKLHQKKAFKD